MIQPGTRMTSPQMEEFLSDQPLTAQFTFDVQSPETPSYEKVFQNEDESFAFIQEHPDMIYEFKYSADYV